MNYKQGKPNAFQTKHLSHKPETRKRVFESRNPNPGSRFANNLTLSSGPDLLAHEGMKAYTSILGSTSKYVLSTTKYEFYKTHPQPHSPTAPQHHSTTQPILAVFHYQKGSQERVRAN